MAIRGIDHIDLAVTDVDRSLAFYLGMLGPLGLAVEGRFRTYRGTEDVVYLGFGHKHVAGTQPETRLGLHPDGIRVEVCHWSDLVRKQWDEGLHLEVKP